MSDNLNLKILVKEKRSELAGKLPDLAIKIFALKEAHYPGCGFYWSMVKSIGALLQSVNDYDNRYTSDQLTLDELVYNELLSKIESIDSYLLADKR